MGSILDGLAKTTRNTSASKMLGIRIGGRFGEELATLLRSFVHNFSGPLFYELAMMALPSDAMKEMSNGDGMEETMDITVAVLKFLCFVYLESAARYEHTEDMFESLAFISRVEMAELQAYCSASMESLISQKTHMIQLLDQRINTNYVQLCDYFLLFIGGRIPLYFNESELSLMHSAAIETILDYNYGTKSELAVARSVLNSVRQRYFATPKSVVKRRPKGQFEIVDLTYLIWALMAFCRNESSTVAFRAHQCGLIQVPIDLQLLIEFITVICTITAAIKITKFGLVHRPSRSLLAHQLVIAKRKIIPYNKGSS